jgi:hypothetical protein
MTVITLIKFSKCPEVMIFFEKNKVLGVEANRVLNILEEIKKKDIHDLK